MSENTKAFSKHLAASSVEKEVSSDVKASSSGLVDQLQSMSDAQLKALKVNAERISIADKHKKKEEAIELLPLIIEQLEVRASQKLAEQTERKKEMARKRAEARQAKAEKAQP